MRHIDCAYVYGNQKEIGDVFQKTLAEGKISRDDLFITSKIAATMYSLDDMEKCMNETLADLQVEYVDLMLLHFPLGLVKGADDKYNFDRSASMQQRWEKMESFVKAGKAKAIGVSNFQVQLLNDLLSYASIKPAVNQIERHPYLQQKGMKQLCDEEGIVLEAYASLGAPGLGSSPDHGKPQPPLLENETIAEIAKKHGKTNAQVLLRWSVDTDVITIPKSVTPSRIEQNFAIIDFKLDDDDLAKIEKIHCDTRYFEHTWTGHRIME